MDRAPYPLGTISYDIGCAVALLRMANNELPADARPHPYQDAYEGVAQLLDAIRDRVEAAHEAGIKAGARAGEAVTH